MTRSTQRPCREPDPSSFARRRFVTWRIRSEDKDLFVRTRRTVALLADQPYPEDAVAWGATGVYRLHAGDIRILYEVDDGAAAVYIINIGVTS